VSARAGVGLAVPSRASVALGRTSWTLPRDVERALLDYEGEVAVLARRVADELWSLDRGALSAAVRAADLRAAAVASALLDEWEDLPHWVVDALGREGVDEQRLVDYAGPYATYATESCMGWSTADRELARLAASTLWRARRGTP